MGDREMRYTTDGSKSEQGTVYGGPFKLAETTTVRAGCFHNPGPHFRQMWGEVADSFNLVAERREPDSPGKTTSGLLLRVYRDNPLATNLDALGEPMRTATVEQIGLNVAEDEKKKTAGYVYTGYRQIDKAGVYHLFTTTEGASRLYIGDRLVVDNHRRYY